MFNPLEIADLVEGEDLEDGGATAGWSNAPGPTDTFPSWPEAAPTAPVAAPPPPPTGGNGLLDDTNMSWLDETNGRGKPAESADSLFDEDDDFFDLAGELEQELSQEDLFQDDGALMPAEQSLEEIVEGFKKGVAEHLSPTDYDTHFNLGIAYREMGLLDEAIGEFQLASKSPGHLVSCCSMLGLCFLDKGLPQLAIKWYQRGLAAPSVSEEDSLGLLYDLGNVYLSVGDTPSAYRTYVELYGINSNYRDVVAKIEELNRAH
jgi:tetratricopeptide (TPR) repeat protein